MKQTKGAELPAIDSYYQIEPTEHNYSVYNFNVLVNFPTTLLPLYWRWKSRNSRFFRDGVVNPTPSRQPGGARTTLRLTPTF